jgi:hypothetical protein
MPCYCRTCARYFVNKQALKQHLRARRHGYCGICDKAFVDQRAADQHNRDFHYYCGECRKYFASRRALEQHCNSLVHEQECRYDGCDDGSFKGQEALNQHRVAAHGLECSCSERDSLVDQQALDQRLIMPPQPLRSEREREPSSLSPGKRLKDKDHETTVARLPDRYCQTCDREFGSELALTQHMSSVVHKPLCANLKCVGGSGCKKTFTSPSAMIHHLESGACASKLTRKMINEFLAEHDTTNIILSSQYCGPKRLKKDDLDSSTSSDDESILTPATFSRRTSISAQSGTSAAMGILTPVSGDATDIEDIPLLCRFVCPLCPPQRGQFGSAKDLENHISSPAHAPKIYHCPVALMGDVGRKKVTVKTFSTLSGLTQHLERDACAGGNTTFRNAIAFVNEKFRGLGFRDVRLLG